MSAQESDRLRELFCAWLAAVPRRDIAALSEMISEEWVYTDYLGEVRDRAGYLDLIEHEIGDDHHTGLVDFTVRLIRPDVALVTGRYTSRGVLVGGEDNDQDSRFTALWEKRADRWMALAHQATNVV